MGVAEGFVLLIGGIFFLMAFLRMAYQLWSIRKWKKYKGTVTKKGDEGLIYVEYRVQGEGYEDSFFYPLSALNYKGKKLTVCCNPEDPGYGAIIFHPLAIVNPQYLLFAGLGIGCILYAFFPETVGPIWDSLTND